MEQKPYLPTETAWCPGCGNHDILATLAGILSELAIPAQQLVLVGGIGQAAKLNQYLPANGFSGLHGRSLPAASGIKMANEALTVIVNTGEGDSYGEGGNHFLHTIRRNVDITHFVHDNQVYGLTKGQVSPTSNSCAVQPGSACNTGLPLDPLLVALAAGATFVARSFSGKRDHLATVMKQAILHKGYALVDILQPCVSFNKVNTFAWYNERVRPLPPEHNTSDKQAAMALCNGISAETIPIGVLYQEARPTWHEVHAEAWGGEPLFSQRALAGALKRKMGSYQ